MTPSAEDLPVAAAAAAARVDAPEPVPDAEPEPGDGEARAWAEVVAAWDDEARHRAYLARIPDLEGLATAGGRYRAALAERPGDALAARFRDEVVRRALALALASQPRAQEPARARRALRLAAGLVLGAVLALGGWLAVHLLAGFGAHA